jgi:hypothetical protein
MSLADDWRAVEDVLNQAGDGASDPFYSQVEEAKGSLFRLGSAAMALEEAYERAVVHNPLGGAA